MNIRTPFSLITILTSALLISACSGDSKSKSTYLPDIEETGSSTTSSQTTAQSASNASENTSDTSDSRADTAQAARPVSGQFAGREGSDFRNQFFADAAQKLEIEVDALVEALGTQMDIEAAAEKLKISVEKLTAALPENLTSGDFGREGGFGDGGGFAALFEGSAEKLGITVDTLVEALGRPINLEAAAEKLEISIDTLKAALPEQLMSRFSGGQGARGGQGQ
jgi:hypothetical protein